MCPKNKSIEHEYITKSKVYVNDAITNASKHPCLWLRGILPIELTELPNHIKPIDQQQLVFINDNDVWDSGTYYGDASGGKHTKYQGLRRVGCAVVRVDSTGVPVVGSYTPLPGEVQTVGRGELFALYILVQLLAPLAQVTFVTDNFNVYKTYSKGPKSAKNSSNCDLYEKVFKMQYDKALEIKVRWMPSHLGLGLNDPRPNNVSHLDVLANDRADHFAGLAAEQVQVSNPISTNHIYYIKLVKIIQRRLALIILNLPTRENDKDLKPVPVPRVKLSTLISNTTHGIVQKANRVYCKMCKCNFALGDPACKHWLSTSCPGICGTLPAADAKPTKVDLSLHRGNSNTHITHDLYSLRGLIYCNKCGARAGRNQFRLLAKPCTTITNYGEQVLKNINNNKLPTGLTIWPEEEM